MLVGMILCNLIFLAFGNVVWSDKKNFAYKTYESNVLYLSFPQLNVEELQRQVEEEEFITSILFEAMTDDGVKLASFTTDEIPFGRIKAGHALSGRKDELIISEGFLERRRDLLLPEFGIGGEIVLGGKSWECIAIAAFSKADAFDALIGIRDFQEHFSKDVTVSLRFRNGTPLSKIRNLSYELEDRFQAGLAVMPMKPSGFSITEFLLDVSDILVLLLIAIINYMFLFRFALLKRTYAYGIFKIHGMTNMETMVFLLAEMLMLIFFSFFVSLSAYLGVGCLLGKGEVIWDHHLEIFSAFFLILLLNLASFLCVIFRFVVWPPVRLMRESVVN